MVFLFQAGDSIYAKAPRAAKVQPPYSIAIKKVDVRPLVKELGTIDGYFSNDLAVKNRKSPESNLPKLLEKKQLFDVAKFCIFYQVTLGARQDPENFKALPKDGQFEVNLGALKEKILQDYNKYFPGQQETCKNYVDTIIMPYVKSELSINKR